MQSRNLPCDVIVSGHICVDLLPGMSLVSPAALTTPGGLAETGPLALATGGAVSNVGLALNRLGTRVGLMAAVGDDQIGKMTLGLLSERDPALTGLIKILPGRGSSYSVVLAPRGCDRSFLHYPGPNATFGEEHVDLDQVRKAKIFHLGYPPLMPRLLEGDGADLRAIYAKVKAAGVVTSMDMVVPDPDGPSGRADWPKILAGVLPHVDVFVPSVDELLFMLRRRDFDAWRGQVLAHMTRDYLHDLTGELLGLGVAVAGVKLGDKGLYMRTGDESTCRRLAGLPIDGRAWANREYYQPAYAVTVAGTTGAGDAAYAGLLAAMLRGLPPQACLQWASAVGACCVEQVDAVSGIKTWVETEARLEAGWATAPRLFSI